MSTTLYRKYRPQKFSEVVAQNHIKVTLQNEIETGKLAHAFLFSGPRGIGKTTIARVLAKALNCQKRQGSEPCCECNSCLEITEGRSLDLIEIDAASNRGINEIRELKEQTKYSPAKDRYKVFIIDEVHMLTTEAFNALLKTLEEPPAHAIFVLATTEIHKIPDTIISRCQRFDFKKVPFLETYNHLADLSKKEGIKVDKEVLENVARLSEGYLRDAISLLGQILSLGEKKIDKETASLVLPRSDWQKVLEFIELLFRHKSKEAIVLINQLLDEGGDLEHFTSITIESLRKILLAKVTADWQEVSWEYGEDWLKSLSQITENIKATEIVRMIDVLLDAYLNMKKTAIIQLPLELAIITITDNSENYPIDKDDGAPPQPPTINKTTKEVQDTKPEPLNNSITKISLNEIKKRWPEVIEALKNYNHSLSSFILAGELLRIEGNKIYLAFEYSFHSERIKEKKNLAIITETLEKVYSCKLTIEGEVIKPSTAKPKKNNDNFIKTALDAFGGEVVS